MEPDLQRLPFPRVRPRLLALLPSSEYRQCSIGALVDIETSTVLKEPLTKATPIRLDCLPAEILATILDFSLEASLIHVSKRLWHNLPEIALYTRSLALKAVAQLEDWPDWFIHVSEPSADILLL